MQNEDIAKNIVLISHLKLYEVKQLSSIPLSSLTLLNF